MGAADRAPTTDINVGMAWVEGVPFAVVNGSFDAVVKLVRGKNRITVEVVDPAENARAEEVVVRCGATWPEVGVVVVVVAGVVAARWAMLGGKMVKRGRSHAVRGRSVG